MCYRAWEKPTYLDNTLSHVAELANNNLIKIKEFLNEKSYYLQKPKNWEENSLVSIIYSFRSDFIFLKNIILNTFERTVVF